MIEYFKLTSYEAIETSKLLTEIFIKEPYFSGWEEEELYRCFREAYHLCLQEGEIWGAFENTPIGRELIGASMWFKYSPGDMVNPMVLPQEIKDIVDPLITPGSKVIYKLVTGILPEHRRKGIGKTLLKRMIANGIGQHFVTDVSSPEWEKMFINSGWSEIATTLGGSKILIK